MKNYIPRTAIFLIIAGHLFLIFCFLVLPYGSRILNLGRYLPFLTLLDLLAIIFIRRITGCQILSIPVISVALIWGGLLVIGLQVYERNSRNSLRFDGTIANLFRGFHNCHAIRIIDGKGDSIDIQYIPKEASQTLKLGQKLKKESGSFLVVAENGNNFFLEDRSVLDCLRLKR